MKLGLGEQLKNYLYDIATDQRQGVLALLIKAIFLLLSFVYGALVRVFIFCHQLCPYRLKCKVISIGNITLGGTGKTSLVKYITSYLKSQQHKIAVLSRGYKRKDIKTQRHKDTNYENMGDEPYMLSQRLSGIPVVVDTNRIRAAQQAIKEYGVDAVVLDDALQQWKIKKDLEIVAIDAVNPFGNRYLIPRGILRQPVSSLNKADIFVLTKTNLQPDTARLSDFLKQINPQAEIVEAAHLPVGFYDLADKNKFIDQEGLKGKTAALICGIGDPVSFEQLVKSLGIDIGLSFRFPDHHHYRPEELDEIIAVCEAKNINMIITTEKDAVRLEKLPITDYRLPFTVLRIELKITKNEEGLRHRLLKLYSL